MKGCFVEIERVPRGYMVTRVIHGSVRIRSLMLPSEFWRCYHHFLKESPVKWVESGKGTA